MKHIFTLAIAVAYLLLSPRVFSQPLPCPPINNTWVAGTGPVTVCNGDCAGISCVDSTSVKSTSSYTFSRIPYLPTSFLPGTTVLLGIDDQYSGVVPLPFPFCFYGTKYTECLLGANGEICFNTSLAGGSCPWSIPGPIPTAGSLNAATLNTIMGVYQDIDPELGDGTISWAIYGTAPCRTFVVSWNNVPYFNTSLCLPDTNTQQIVIYESTYAIDIFVKHKPYCTAWNHGWADLGIVDATGANYNIPPEYNATVFSMDDSGFRFTPNGPASWTYTWTDPTGAVVGTTQSVTVCPTVATLYTVTAMASSNCDSYKVHATVQVLIGGNPVISHTTSGNPTQCGLNNGFIKLFGLIPGLSDTIWYDYGGVVQPYIVQTSLADSSLTIPGLCAGTYSNIRVKVGGCWSNTVGPITLTNLPISISSLTFTLPTQCDFGNGTITLYGLYPGVTYTITYNKAGVAQPPLTLTADGAGTVTITGLYGDGGITYSNIVASFTNCPTPCTTPPAGPVTLLTPPPIPIYLSGTPKNPTQCGYCDGVITLRAVIPYTSDTITYSLDGVPQPPVITYANPDSSITLGGLCGGTYSNFTVKVDYCLMGVSGTATLAKPTLVSNFTDVIHPGCHGDTVEFTNLSNSPLSTPPINMYYRWNFGDSTTDSASNPDHIYAQGTFTVTLTVDNRYCVTDTSFTVTLYHPLKAGFSLMPDILCQNNPVVFTDTSTGIISSYQWLFGNGATANAINATYTYKNAGVYNAMLIVGNTVPCWDTAMAIVQVDSQSGVHLELTDSILCRSTDINFTGIYTSSGNTGVTWNFGDGDSVQNMNPVVRSYDATGIFTVTANVYFRACRDTGGTRVVHIYPQPVINLGPGDTTICAGGNPLVLADKVNKDNPLASWKWSTGETGPQITVVAPGIYSSTVMIYGCTSSFTVNVENDCYMNIPNVFSPNGDGVNDYFFPRTLLSAGLISFNMNIYNRWGELIFQSAGLEGRGWDGRLNNVDQPEGVYVYIIDAEFKDGQKEHHQGNVTLIR